MSPPAGHARVEDGVMRVLVADFDYRPLLAVDDDVLHLDWDTAVSLEDLLTFAKVARMFPAQPLVAPMLEYPGGLHGTTRRALTRPTWNIRRYEGANMRDCTLGEQSCHLFGFGMVYLPLKLLAEHVASLEPGVPVTDIGFSGWYAANGGECDVCWDVRPVHLNYPAPHVL